jgi:hypothetical protein
MIIHHLYDTHTHNHIHNHRVHYYVLCCNVDHIEHLQAYKDTPTNKGVLWDFQKMLICVLCFHYLPIFQL